MLSEHPVDLAIVDIFMPKVDGMEPDNTLVSRRATSANHEVYEGIVGLNL